MPLYPYRCTQCSHRFEKIQSFSAEPEKVCPKCGGPVERVLTAPGLQFKGAGWYVNDYSSKSSSSDSSSDSSKSTSETKTPETKTPAKTESTPAPAAAPAASSGPTTS